MVIIPAGVGHKNLGASPDLCVVGAYPPNQTPDICDDKTMSNPDHLTFCTKLLTYSFLLDG